MNALIIEDEQLAAERLSNLIMKTGDIDVVGQFDTIKDTVAYLKKNKETVDILFCDVQLADGLSFNIFDKVEINMPVVFTTAYDEYSLKAFEVNSLDYLLKPIRYEDLRKAISKYESIYQERHFKVDAEMLRNLFKQRQFRERFLVKLGSRFYNKPVEEVSYFSSENRIVYLHDGQAGRKFVTDFTLDELMREHLDPQQFFRISRQFIVKIHAIETMKTFSNQRLILQLKSGQIHELIVSREKVPSFKEWFE